MKLTANQRHLHGCDQNKNKSENILIGPFTDKAQTALFKDPVRTAL